MYSVIEKVIFLQDIDVFREVRTEDLSYLAMIAEEITYLPGKNLYEINQAPDSLYLVIDGKVKLHRDGQEISIIGPGEAIGTWSLFDNQPRVATATALEETKALRIDREEFYELLSDHVRIAESVLRSLSRRLRALVERLN
jgi:CRP-like cAMP-binding protein